MLDMKLKVLVIAILSAILVGVVSYSYIRVNTQYPQKELKEYHINERIDFQSYYFTVTNAELLWFDDFKQKYDYHDDIGQTGLADEQKTQVMLISLSVENPTSKELPMPPVMYFTLECLGDAYSTNCDMYMFMSLYDYNDSLLKDNIPPYGKVEVLLPFNISAVYLNVFDGGLLNMNCFEYVLSLYPVKNYVTFVTE